MTHTGTRTSKHLKKVSTVLLAAKWDFAACSKELLFFLLHKDEKYEQKMKKKDEEYCPRFQEPCITQMGMGKEDKKENI